MSNETQVQYDADGNIVQTTDAAGNVSHTYYNLLNVAVLAVDPMGYSQFTVVGPTGEDLADINQIGAVSRSIYNAASQIVMTIDPLGHTGQTQYDADGNAILITDGRGFSTKYLYTADNQQAAAIDPNANVQRNVFNAIGQTVQTIDGNGHTSVFGYDAMGNQNSFTDANSNTSESVFSVGGGTLETIDANSNVTINTLDGLERPVSVKDPLGNVSAQSFDPAGLVVSTTDAAGKVSDYGYDKNNELTSITDPNAHTATMAYNNLQQQVASYDPSQNGTYSGFNADGQTSGSGLQTGASSVTTFYANGQESQFADPDGNRTVFLIDQAGNAVGQIDPQGHFSYVSFNADNQPTVRVDADGRAIDYTYDNAGRETSEVWLNAAGVQQNSLTFGYDSANNLTSASSNYGSYGFTLDSGNRVTAETTPFSITLNFSYDSNSNVTTMTGAGATLNSVYNGDNLLTSRRLSGGPGSAQLRFDITYTADNQIATIKRYADTAGTTFLGQTQTTYDPAGNITEIRHTNASGTTLEDFQYSWTVANLLSSETDTISGTPTTTNYGYDTSQQLTSAGSTNFSYDANGSRTTTGFTVGANNQITSDGTWNYLYDPAGNLVEKDGISNGLTWKFNYDNQNHLVVAAEYSSGTLQYQVAYSYDVFGNLVEQDVTQSGTITATKFLNDRSGNIFADLSSSNAVQGMRVYLDALDSVMAIIGSTGTENWDLADHLGSVRGVMSNSGSLADAITYDAFGNITTETSPSNGDRYKFAGGQFNSTTGLYQFGARFYSPATGSWTSQDPLGLLPDTNPYRYVSNQPTGATDPTGLVTSLGGCGSSTAMARMCAMGMNGLSNVGQAIAGAANLIAQATVRAAQFAWQTFVATGGVIRSIGPVITRMTFRARAIFLTVGEGLRQGWGWMQQRAPWFQMQWQRFQNWANSPWFRTSPCFAAGTPLLTPDGEKFIEEFKQGDLVLSRPENDPDGPVEAKPVEEVFVKVSPVLNLHVGGRVIRTSPEHPFYVEGRGWIPAAMLENGDLLRSHDGQRLPVQAVTNSGEVTTVYNLRVAEYHTYFVGCASWRFSLWAHNADYGINGFAGAIQAIIRGLSNQMGAIAARIQDAQARLADLLERAQLGVPGLADRIARWFCRAAVKVPVGLITVAKKLRAHPRFACAIAVVLGVLGWGCVSLWGQYHLDVARRACQRGRFHLAQRHLDRCLAVWPNNYEARLLAARVCRVRRAYRDAELHLSTCLESAGLTEDLQRERTLLDAQTGAFPGLEMQLRSWVEEGPAQTSTLEALVFCLIVESRVALARFYLDRWLKDDPDNSLALFWRGLTRQRIGDLQEAHEDYVRAVQLDPDNAEARVQLVQLLFLRNHFDEAQEHLSILAGAEPGNPEVWLLLGLDRFHRADWQQADDYFARVLCLDPAHGRAIHQRGLVALQQGRLADAERWLRLALAAAPTARDAAASAPVALTEPERAVAHYSLYLCLLQQPERKQAAAAELAAYQESRDLTRRLNNLLAHIEKQPQDPAPLIAAAEILLKRRQTFVAGQYLQRALQLAPNDDKVRRLLAECLH